MGAGRWMKVLRFVICFIVILMIMIGIGPEAC